MTGTIHCPGCGRRAFAAAVVCDRCREFLPQSVRVDLDAAAHHPALMPLAIVAVINAVSDRPLPPPGKDGPIVRVRSA